MKKHNRIIADILAVCLMGSVSAIPESIAPVLSMTASAEDIELSGTCGENVTWRFDDTTDTLTISGEGAMEEYIDGLFMKETPWGYISENIKHIVVEEGVTTIGAAAFCHQYDINYPSTYKLGNYSSLISVELAESVEYIGEYAFLCCSNLNYITIKNPDCTFYDDDRTICNSYKYDDDYYFNGMIYGYSGSNVQAYAEKYDICFKDLESEEIYYYGESDIDIDSYTYENCGDYIKITGCNTTESKINIPSEIEGLPVKVIRNHAFNDNNNIISVRIPDSVTTIEYHAFTSCRNLEMVLLPENIKNISGLAFINTKWLKSKVYEIEQIKNEVPLIIINDMILSGQYCTGDVVIPEGVKRICDDAFYYLDTFSDICCNRMTSIKIPDSVDYIGESAFCGCSSLKSVTILNPECEIWDLEDTIPETTVIYGYENSTAQAYAEKYGYKFESLGEAPEENTVTGDLNGDNEFNVSDVVTFQKYILGGSDKEISDWKQADLNNDGILDVFDLCMMKKKLIEKIKNF